MIYIELDWTGRAYRPLTQAVLTYFTGKPRFFIRASTFGSRPRNLR